ncbi:hypothetical protein T08_1045 [Trichinella sp. T8]|nr:hypothetical protein T08_1045 [Trichinella sp. T8]
MEIVQICVENENKKNISIGINAELQSLGRSDKTKYTGGFLIKPSRGDIYALKTAYGTPNHP